MPLPSHQCCELTEPLGDPTTATTHTTQCPPAPLPSPLGNPQQFNGDFPGDSSSVRGQEQAPQSAFLTLSTVIIPEPTEQWGKGTKAQCCLTRRAPPEHHTFLMRKDPLCVMFNDPISSFHGDSG